ncbi:protein SOB FIVE-LIKE 5-like [Phragmites australis]|uniref:protein SOB FIVE-LIKE 5-like n=1 Tax=Phragmites australis TaxID=29695 RepID=UPI002D76C488|nr:protein SOB FIVE-LIKE 5-like [Phragmites australis]
MLVGMDGELEMAAASSEYSGGCQSGWTTYLDDHSSYSCGTARLHGKAQQPYYCEYYSEEDDLSMISDASSGPRQQSSAGNDVEGGAAAHANAERRGRREEAAAARRQSKRAAAAALLEDTASSPAFFSYSKAMSSGEANGYGNADAPMMEIGNAADFSCAFSATSGFKSPLGGYLQMQYSPAPVKPMPTRQVCIDGVEKKRW